VGTNYNKFNTAYTDAASSYIPFEERTSQQRGH
jgi:hypothetical protein